MGVGAFAAAHIAASAHLPLILTVPLGGLAAIPVGFLVGLVTLRAGGVLTAVVTLGFGAALSSLFFTADFNGGATGSMALARTGPLSSPLVYCWFEIAVVALLIAFVCALRTRRAGRRMAAVRELRARSRCAGHQRGTHPARRFRAQRLHRRGCRRSVRRGGPGGLITVLRSIRIDRPARVRRCRRLGQHGRRGDRRPPPGNGTRRHLGTAGDQPPQRPRRRRWRAARRAPARAGEPRAGRAQSPAAARRGCPGRPAPRSAPRRHAGEGFDVSALLEVHGVGVDYGGHVAVDGVSLAASRGEIVGLIGPNGAGKTTLLDVVAGENVPNRGRIELDGRDITRLPSWRRARLGVGRTFQAADLVGSLTVHDNLMLGCQARQRTSLVEDGLRVGRSRHAEALAAREVGRVLDLVGIRSDASRQVGSLPLGRRRLVEIARALCASAPPPPSRRGRVGDVGRRPRHPRVPGAAADCGPRPRSGPRRARRRLRLRRLRLRVRHGRRPGHRPWHPGGRAPQPGRHQRLHRRARR